MAIKEKQLSSGSTLNITTGSFQESHKLFKIVLKELGSLDRNEEINHQLMLRLLSSDEVEAALWPCLNRCTFNNMKIVPKLFDEHEEARGDYLEIAGEVLGFNLDPFLKSQSFKFSEVKAENTSSLR